MILKKKIDPKVVGDGAVHGRGFAASRVRFYGHGIWHQCHGELARN